MGKVMLVVELEIAAGRMAEYLTIAESHRTRCLDTEQGCLRFDVLRERESEDRIILVELYADDAAVEEHLGSERMTAYRTATADLISSRVLHRCDVALG